MFRGHEVVYSEVKTFPVITYSKSVPALYETVCQSLGNGVSCIGDGGVVEVTAHDDGIVPVLLYVLMYNVGLF